MKAYKTKSKPYRRLERDIRAHNKQMQGMTMHASQHRKRCKDFEKLDRVREEFCVVMNVILGDYSRIQPDLVLDRNAKIALQKLQQIDVNDMKTHCDISNLGKFIREIPRSTEDDVGKCLQNSFKKLIEADNRLRHNAYKTIYDQETYKSIAKMFRDSIETLTTITDLQSLSTFKNKKFIQKRIKLVQNEIEKL